MNAFKHLISIAGLLLILAGCSENPYYDIPTDENGRAIITGVSSATTSGITEDENEFTVTATLPNAKPGDRSEERRVGKEGRSQGTRAHQRERTNNRQRKRPA